MMKYQHILFDLDRTLWDFETNSKLTILEIFDELQLNKYACFEEFYPAYLSINQKLWQLYREGKIGKEHLRTERFRLTLAKFKIHNPSMAEEFADEYIKRSPMKTSLLPGTYEILQYLSHKGYLLHIATNGFKEVQWIKLRNCRIHHFFQHVFISELIGYNKPDLRFFKYTLKRLNTPAEKIVMIGDDYEADIEGSRNAGIDQIYFSPHDQRQATYHIRNLLELQKIL